MISSGDKSFIIGARPAGLIGNVINSIGDAVKSREIDNSRLQGALALKAGYDAWKLAESGTGAAKITAQAAAEKGVVGADSAAAESGIGVQVYFGSSQSKREEHQQRATVSGTNLQAKSIDLTATETDLTLIGAKVEAERVALAAARDVLLTAAANTAEVQGKSSGSSFGGGVTFSFGGTQNGISFQLNASRMQGKKNGHETVWDNTLVSATESLNVTSGRDTTLAGAQVAGKSVLFDVGGQLLIESLQDRTHYEDKQRSSGFSISVCVPPICAGAPVTGSAGGSSQTITHNTTFWVHPPFADLPRRQNRNLYVTI